MKTEQLRAGAGRAEIRFPAALFPLEGFQGVHDDPAARVLLLDCGERAAIACLELVMLSPDGIDAVKQKIGAATNTKPEHIWVHTTHAITTPHAPHAPMGMGGIPLEISEEEKRTLEEKRALYQTALLDAVGEAAEGAARTLQSARMGVGTGTCRVNVNRDVCTDFGWWIGFAPEGPSDHTAAVLCFESTAGAPIASLISYGLKPCAIDNSEMDQGTRLVSSDVPGLACKLLEEQFGAPCLFAMSAAGDQVPLRQAWYDVVEPDGTLRKVDLGVQEGLAIVGDLGRQMAREIAPILEETRCGECMPRIKLDAGHIDWPGKARAEQVLTREARYTREGMQRVDVLTMTIGDVALVGLKPELNMVTQTQLQAASPYGHTLVVSMVNGGQKYMPDRTSYEHGTWEAQSAPVMPGAAEAWVEKTVQILNGMKEGEK
ncbi:MAG: hypothetical protein ACI4O5_03705 [Oscillospiraceae bacterium]